MNENTYRNLVVFWRDVEALSPQSLPKKAPNDPNAPVRDLVKGQLPPWLDRGFKSRPIIKDNEWRHSIYGAVYEIPRLIEQLERRLGKQADTFEERAGGQSCVFSIAFDENGRPLVETMMISMAAWAFGIVVTKGLAALAQTDACDTSGLHVPEGGLAAPPSDSGFPGFDLQLTRLREEFAWRLGNLPPDQPIGLDWFDDFVTVVVEKLRIGDLVGAAPTHRVRSVQVRRPKKGAKEEKKPKTEDDLLNSFFVKDLNRMLAGHFAGSGVALRRYLEPSASAKISRVDVRAQREQALSMLAADNFPEGTWPAEHPLVWSQQVAINAMWKELRTGGCFAVNGPPGTGKTTLLRDIVAAIVVERAHVLATRGSSLFGEKRGLDVGGRTIPYYILDPALSGFSIVVGSSNNGAVENVSLELPRMGAIHSIWAGEVDAYRDLSDAVLGEPSWAMIAGKLGNKKNRSDFVSSFWWQKGEDGVAGLRERLESIKNGKASPAVPWKEAVARFRQALADERGLRGQITQMAVVPSQLASLGGRRAASNDERSAVSVERTAVSARVDDLTVRIAEAGDKMKRLCQRIDALRTIRPGLLEWISTLGKAQRQWRADLRVVMDEQGKVGELEANLRRHRISDEQALAGIATKIAEIERRLQQIAASIVKAEGELAKAKDVLGRYWPDLTVPEEDQERTSPWAYPQWRAARIRVFLAAMNLHRSFIENNANEMMANLGVAMDMLQGGIPCEKARAVALESFALACPVISSTFASVANLFGVLGPETIGWLLIDEAGQATPQAAAGAIWRSKRVVVVGDPLQLEPVVTLPRTVEAAIASFHGRIAARWHPSRTSVQILADQTTPIGTTLGEGDEGIWVGAPLRVHRRCDDPMFSVSNAVAYDGLMVHQKKPSSVSWPASAWIDVPGASGDGNWIPAEGQALHTLLRDLLQQHQVPATDIFLISPFRDVVRELRRVDKAFGLDPRRIGTVHTAQGKEADVVILVLGGGTAGARDWAASKPNLLNVAASRAKTRLYVIGDRSEWAKRRHFDVLHRKLG